MSSFINPYLSPPLLFHLLRFNNNNIQRIPLFFSPLLPPPFFLTLFSDTSFTIVFSNNVSFTYISFDKKVFFCIFFFLLVYFCQTFSFFLLFFLFFLNVFINGRSSTYTYNNTRSRRINNPFSTFTNNIRRTTTNTGSIIR
ncbi:hypothetical protein BDA99DRAFT_513310 [Phascolomyces articulosus]|uniref:Uncharacterized protein n=1 Tax=Phascolomyces articulosus TaxID=60185 RepID=A0AAD5K857_9FUNG|nr:hypothetical protein BDA99DRAFT_513310 [Phascolomyces articulosus]